MPIGTIHCPICKKEVPLDDPNMPFCSDRCRIIDLGNWATEKYTIPAIEVENGLQDLEESEEPEQPEGRSR